MFDAVWTYRGGSVKKSKFDMLLRIFKIQQWVIGQTRSSFHLGVLESVYIKTQNPVLCRQKDSFSLLDSSIKGRVAARWLVIKATNHARHFPLMWFRSASGYLGTVRCLAIIRHFILWRVSDEKVLSVCWKYVSAFLCYSKVLQYKASV